MQQIIDIRNDIIGPQVGEFWDENYEHLSDKERLKWSLFHILAGNNEQEKMYFDLREQQKNNVLHVTGTRGILFGIAAISFFYLGYINWQVCNITPHRLTYVTDKVGENADVIKEETNQIDSAIKLVAEDFQKKYADLENKLQTINDNIQKIDSNLVTVNDNLRKFAR